MARFVLRFVGAFSPVFAGLIRRFQRCRAVVFPRRLGVQSLRFVFRRRFGRRFRCRLHFYKGRARALGYSRARDAVRAFCKGGVKLPLHTGRGKQVNETTIIPEADVYRLVLKSNMPKAGAFQDWIVEEVIPSIRKHGIYIQPSPAIQDQTRKEMLDALVDRLIAEREKVRGFQSAFEDCAPSTPYGVPSEYNGNPRQQLVRAYWRSARRMIEPPEWLQMALFGPNWAD